MKTLRILALVAALLAATPPHARAQSAGDLCSQVVLLHRQGKYLEALPLAEMAVEISKNDPNEQPLNYAICLNNLGVTYKEIREYKKAESSYQKAIRIRREVLGQEHPIYVESINNLGCMYYEMAAYDRAEPLLFQAMEARGKILGEMHPDYASSLDSLASLYRAVGSYGKAEPHFQQALAIREKVLGPEHAQTAQSLNNLAGLYKDKGTYQKAEPLYARALAICEKVLGPDHPITAMSMNNLATLYKDMGTYGKAEPLCKRALAICEKVLGPDHSDTATSLNNLAALYRDMGEYGKAEPLYERALAICVKVLGPEHPVTAPSLNNLAELYQAMGDYAKAEPLFQRALAIAEKVLGPEHPHTATSLDNLASLYQAMGEYGKAETLLQHALAIREKVLGPDHPDTATSLNSLALLYHVMGGYVHAAPLYERALAIREKVLGPEHPNTAASLNNLGMLYRSMDEPGKAEPFCQRSLMIKEKAFGSEHPSTAKSLNNLAAIYHAMGDYGKAEPLCKRALAICEKALDPEHPDTAASLNNLAVLYYVMGDYGKAEPIYQRALAIREKLGPMHSDTATSLGNLAYCRMFLENLTQAAKDIQKAESCYRVLWSKLLRFASERQREAAIQTVGSLDLCGTFGNGALAANSLLWRKGALLDSLVEDRLLAQAAGADKELAAQFALAENLKGILQQALMEGNKARLSEEQIAKYQAELEDLQKALALKVGGLGETRRSLECSVEQVQAAIPKATVLVDFMRYAHAIGKGKWEDRYAAVLVMPDHDPVFVPLGKAEVVDAALERHRKLTGSKPAANETAARNAELESACKALHALIGVPVEAALPPGTTELILCPDGQLHFLAFSSLIDKDGKLWAECFTLRNISTARDLLKLPRSRASDANKTIVLVGNPDFRDSTPLALVAEVEDANDQGERQRLAFNLTRSGQNEELRGLSFRPLQGTAVEVAGLRIRFERQGWKTQILTGPEAGEVAVVAAVNSPGILHLATHGFFVDELDLGQKKARERQAMNGGMGGDDMRLRGAARDPMLRSGLALSGAQSTHGLWQNGKVPPIDKDGILTAAEVASLRLHGTRLVTLSACETGLGESKSGEGVLGLQRALALAGAENLVLTLWSISDADTVALMAAFYDRVLAGEHPARALPEVQREALIRLRKEHGLWHAVNRAAPFVIVSNTTIPATAKH